jgi:hypothetical protein
MCTRIENVFSEKDILTFLEFPQVIAAKETLASKRTGSEYFSIPLSSSLKNILFEKLGLDLTTKDTIPMRWIKGDTPSHMDTGAGTFEQTYLVYLTTSEGHLIVDGQEYPITQGTAYTFPEGLSHETTGTGVEPRLLLGPMSEEGLAVGGGSTIAGDGGTTLYIRQVGSNIRYSSDPNTLDGLIIGWPCTVQNSNISGGNLIIDFVTDITLNGINKYFICGTEFIQFGSQSLKNDGTRHVITIDGVANYPGLVQNGISGTGGANYIYIFNLTIASINGSTLATGGGWAGQAYFGKGATFNYIVNCKSNGEISINGGGIVGSYAGSVGGVLYITGCSSSGNIDINGGGIVGANAVNDGGSMRCNSCYSIGDIYGTGGGGILGSVAATLNDANATVQNCYSKGFIADESGGICGYGCGNGGTVNITNCYSEGDIYDRGGGIMGNQTVNTLITNCYTIGNLLGSGAGGLIVGNDDPTVSPFIINCYTSGTVPGFNGYIIGGSGSVPTHCYSEAANGSSGWNTIHATDTLSEPPIPTVSASWVSTGVDQPFELSIMGYTPYTTVVVSINFGGADLIRSYESSIAAGSATSAAIIPGQSYTLLAIAGDDPDPLGTITLDVTTGIISTTSSTRPDIYSLYIRNTGSYNITEYSLTVTEAGVVVSGGAEEQTSCCERELHLSNTTDYTTRNHFKEGNTLIGSTAIRRGPTFYGALYNKKMAYSAKW